MSEGQGYALPPAVLDLDEEVFYLRVERSVCKGRKHDRKIIVEVEQQLNKRQFGRHLPAKQAKKAMMDLGILAEHMPSDRALDGVRHRHLEQGKSYDGKSVSTFGAFCQSPPLPVVVLKAEETPLVSSFRRNSSGPFLRARKLGCPDCLPSCTGSVCARHGCHVPDQCAGSCAS